MTFNKTMYRQGDVLIMRLNKAQKKNIDKQGPGERVEPDSDGRLIVAYGEATGHHHALVGDNVTMEINEGSKYFTVNDVAASLVHEEHGTIELPPGDYAVMGQREYVEKDKLRPVYD